MAFVLTPVYQAPQYSPFGLCAPAARSIHRYRGCPQSRRVPFSPFSQFFGQVDELLSEIDRQAQRQAHYEALRKAHLERQQRKRALRAQFAVNQTESGWQVDGKIQGFEQDNLSIEVTDDHTLKITGNTEWQSESATAQETPNAAEQATGEEAVVITTVAAATESETSTVAADSDTESVKSHQATVEDDFEDLGAETASMRSASESTTVSEPQEPKGKEKAAEAVDSSEKTQEAPAQQEQAQEQERVHGSFERTFQFPERIDVANVRAEFKDGVLRITVPRAPVQEAKRITIS